jgi:hypothetical protein
MSRGPLGVIVEDILLIAAAALALWLAPAPDRAARPARWKTPFLTLLAVGSTAFALASPRLPIDDMATALKPGVRLGDLGLDAVAGNLAEGDRLLVILELDEEASQRAVPALNALATTAGVPPLAGLTLSDDEKRAEFFFAHAPAFEILEVPASDLRRLYRRAPRTFTVHNGEVARVWQGIPPAEELAR